MRSNLTLAAIAAPVLALAPVALADLSPLADWNLIVRDSIVTSTSEVDGSAIVGGSVSGTTVFAVHNVTAPGHVGLALGGNINPNGISINNGGNLRIGGSVNGFRNLNGGGTQVTDNTVPAQLTSIFSQLASVSSYLNTLTPNGSIDGAGNMNAVPTNINGQLVAVYSFNQSAIQSLGQLNLNFGAAQSVIINISSAPGGAADFVAPPNLIGGFNQGNSSRILWNFSNTTSITVNNSFNGAILAPDASLAHLGGGINGSVAVREISTLSAEIRNHNYTGFIPTPGAAALLALAGLTASRRRR